MQVAACSTEDAGGCLFNQQQKSHGPLHGPSEMSDLLWEMDML